jgi:Holliday junction resolvasome RuvABC endonuclease subunit
MKILGIDQSLTSTGWCLLEDGELSEYGLIGSDKNANKFYRMKRVAYELWAKALTKRADIISLEGLPFGNLPGNVGKDLAGLQAAIVIELQEDRHALDENLFLVPPTTIKKFATGSGKAKKEDMFEALPDIIKAKFSSTPKSRGRYDITDAYWLAKYIEEGKKKWVNNLRF